MFWKQKKQHVICCCWWWWWWWWWWWKCNFEIQQNLEKIKKLLGVDFDSQPVYDEKYIKTWVKTFEDKVITKFADNEVPKENTHYSCIAPIFVDSKIKLESESYPQVNLEQCTFRLEKKKDIDLFEDSSDETEIEAQWI